ncbi:MAG: type II toxin-antitoxin system HicA family toxin [Acidobacteria bacterium]|nr:MAG: type II toxin-antitoxin system HicA family toxin [Acidobacteriota bacterium]
MAPRLKRFTTRQVVAALHSFGFEVVASRGSHAKLRRVGGDGSVQILTVPLHGDLAAGTLLAVYRAARFIPDAELREWFLTK